MDLGRRSSAALMLSGLAGVVTPEKVAAALELPATTGLGAAALGLAGAPRGSTRGST